MSLFTKPAKRSVSYADVWGDIRPSSVRASDVTRLAPVYAAVSLLADLFSSAPARVVRELEDGQQEQAKTPLIMSDPDPYLSERDWRYQAVVSLKLRGNAFGLVDVGRRYIRWLDPDWVVVDDQSQRLVPRYYVNGQEVTLAKQGGSLVHIREFVQPGRVLGLSPVAHFMSDFDVAAKARDFGRTWFHNAAVPPAILQSQTKGVSGEALREARDDFIAATKEGKPVALPGEWSWQKISLTADEAQFLTTIKATATTIATIFRVSPEDVGGESGSSRTYSNREADAELLNVRTLQPIGLSFSAAFKDVLPPQHRVLYDLDALAQPGLLASAKLDTEELKNGTATLDEVRRRRGRKPLTVDQVEQWLRLHGTSKSQSESNATSLALTEEES